jgi:hypothetical protein
MELLYGNGFKRKVLILAMANDYWSSSCALIRMI